jgi:small basic protein (TIGR04137 family)
MSLHKSLVPRARLKRQRNVLARWERILRLKEEDRWAEGRSVFSLPKVKVVHFKRHKKAKKEAAAEGAEAAVTPAEGAPTPTATAEEPSSKASAAKKAAKKEKE